jgi:hypothetical protein
VIQGLCLVREILLMLIWGLIETMKMDVMSKMEKRGFSGFFNKDILARQTMAYGSCLGLGVGLFSIDSIGS